MEIILLVADLADRLAGELFHPVVVDRIRPAHLAGENDPVRRHERLDAGPRLRARRDEQVDDLVGDSVADLVGMPFGHRLARKQVVAPGHARLPGSIGTTDKRSDCGARDRGRGSRPQGRMLVARFRGSVKTFDATAPATALRAAQPRPLTLASALASSKTRLRTRGSLMR